MFPWVSDEAQELMRQKIGLAEMLKGGAIMDVTNADQDVLLDVDSQVHYVLLSGRWYTSKTLEGPWSFAASDALPGTFADIPPDSDQAHLLFAVAATILFAGCGKREQPPPTLGVANWKPSGIGGRR